MSDHLFPRRLTRRDFLLSTGAAAAGLALAPSSVSGQSAAPVRIGSGFHTYELDADWGKLPEGMKYGHGCGIVVDGSDRIYVTTRSTNPCVCIFDTDGKLLETWSNDLPEKNGCSPAQFADTAHGLHWKKQDGVEYLYWTENNGSNKTGPRTGARVYKTDLQGKILYQIGNVASESSTAQKFDWDNPTDLAVAPNGDIYVVDGYGSQRVTRFDKNFKALRTIGGEGTEDGKFKTCHGIWVNTLKGEPEVYIADRANSRIQVFDLELNHKRNLSGMVRNPCCFFEHKGFLYIPDLAARVTILDAQDGVAAQLGDGKETDSKTDRPDNQTNPALFAAPHALNLDSKDNLYVVEWIPAGRPRKFKHVPA